MSVRHPSLTSAHTRSGLHLLGAEGQALALAQDVRAAVFYARDEADALWQRVRLLTARLEQLESWQEECGKNVEDEAERGHAP